MEVSNAAEAVEQVKTLVDSAEGKIARVVLGRDAQRAAWGLAVYLGDDCYEDNWGVEPTVVAWPRFGFFLRCERSMPPWLGPTTTSGGYRDAPPPEHDLEVAVSDDPRSRRIFFIRYDLAHATSEVLFVPLHQFKSLAPDFPEEVRRRFATSLGRKRVGGIAAAQMAAFKEVEVLLKPYSERITLTSYPTWEELHP